MKIGVRKGGKYADGMVPQAPNIGIRPGGEYADGVVPSDPSVMGFIRDRAQAAIDALTPSKTTAQPVVQAVTQNTGLTGGAVSAMQAQNKANEEALNLKDGVAKLDGPGTSTSDSIPAHLSKGEAVLPAKTVQAVGSDNIANLIAQTNTKPKIGIRAGGKYADGTVPTSGAYQAGQAVRQAASALPGALEKAEAPIKAIGTLAAAPLTMASNAIGQFGRGVFGMGPSDTSPAAAPAAVAPDAGPFTAADHARAAASAAQALKDAGVAQPAATPAGVAPTGAGIGVARPTQTNAAAPLPRFGVSGTGYVRNEQTGATQTFAPPITAQPVAPAQSGRPSTGNATLDRISAINDAAAAANIARAQGAAGLETAQTAEVAQKAAQSKQLTDIQAEMRDPNITPQRMVQLREAIANMTGRELYKPMATVDAMGNPTMLYNTQTGLPLQTSAAQPAGQAAAVPTQPGAPTFATLAEAQAAKAAGKIKSGDIVNTPNGPIKVH